MHTAAAPVVTDLGEMYRQADVGAIFSLFSRLGMLSTNFFACPCEILIVSIVEITLCSLY